MSLALMIPPAGLRPFRIFEKTRLKISSVDLKREEPEIIAVGGQHQFALPIEPFSELSGGHSYPEAVQRGSYILHDLLPPGEMPQGRELVIDAERGHSLLVSKAVYWIICPRDEERRPRVFVQPSSAYAVELLPEIIAPACHGTKPRIFELIRLESECSAAGLALHLKGIFPLVTIFERLFRDIVVIGSIHDERRAAVSSLLTFTVVARRTDKGQFQERMRGRDFRDICLIKNLLHLCLH